MSSPTPVLGVHPAALDAWVPILEASLPADENGMLVRLAGTSGQAELGVLPLGGSHPLELLEGTVAPPEWLALGVVSRGWASPWDGARPSRHPARVRIVATVLLDRAGNVAGRVVAGDGTVVLDQPPVDGAVPDALRAALDLP